MTINRIILKTWSFPARLQLVVILGSPASLRFWAPTPLPSGGGPFFDGFKAIGPAGAAVSAWGKSGAFAFTSDGGRSWRSISANASGFPSNTTVPASTEVLVPCNNQGGLHNLGNLDAHMSGNMTAVTATGALRLSWNKQRRAPSAAADEVQLSVTGIPPPGINMLRLGGADIIQLEDGSMLGSFIVKWAQGSQRSSIAAFRSTDDGISWKFVSHIAQAEKIDSNEGPNENSLALLQNGTLMCVMRLDAGDAGRYHRYAVSISADKGVNWSPPQMTTVGAARPRLLRLGSSLLLSGGRTWSKNRDSFVWLSINGTGYDWVGYSISYWHNQFVSNTSQRFDPYQTNSSDHWPRESNSYTSLIKTGSHTAIVTYDLRGSGWAMPIEQLDG